MTTVTLPQPDNGGLVESHRPLCERREIFSLCGIGQPDATVGDTHRW